MPQSHSKSSIKPVEPSLCPTPTAVCHVMKLFLPVLLFQPCVLERGVGVGLVLERTYEKLKQR
jgi:hypothetical protein